MGFGYQSPSSAVSRPVTIVSTDGVEVRLPGNAMEFSGQIRDWVTAFGDRIDMRNMFTPEDVKADAKNLNLIARYLQNHIGDTVESLWKVDQEQDRVRIDPYVDPRDEAFFKSLSIIELRDLLLLANFLDMSTITKPQSEDGKDVLQTTGSIGSIAKYIARDINSLSPAEIKQKYNI
jgi:hypothetical protein